MQHYFLVSDLKNPYNNTISMFISRMKKYLKLIQEAE